MATRSKLVGGVRGTLYTVSAPHPGTRYRLSSVRIAGLTESISPTARVISSVPANGDAGNRVRSTGPGHHSFRCEDSIR